MKLYRSKIPAIAHAVIETLVRMDAIAVSAEMRQEAERDLQAIMEEYLRRDNALRERVREVMADQGIPYDRYAKVLTQLAEEWGHPVREDVEKFLARQIVENFMISRFIDEVFLDDKEMYKTTVDVLRKHEVDENSIREEAKERIKNLSEGSVEYEIAMTKAVRDVKKKYGLI
jgi:hypothetical protein